MAAASLFLLWAFQASANPSPFHTGWCVESLATQPLVVFVSRTAGNPFKSRPSWPLLISVLAVATALLTVTYLALIQVVKTWFYRRHALL
jgi:Mg2+-importing ATPase